MPSSPSTVQSTQNSSPWSGQQPFLSDIFSRAQQQANNPIQPYSGSKVVPFSAETQNALGLQANRAMAGSPLVQQAQQNVQQSLQGNLNPALQNMIGQVQEQAKGQINPIFAQAGRGLSGAHANALASAMQNAGTQLAYQDYGNSMNAAIPLANQDYFDIGQLANVGQAREGQAGAYLQDEISRYNEQQQAPLNALQRYAALISGGNVGGSTTSTQPYYANPLMTYGGLGLGAASAGGSLFGSGGIFPQGTGFPIKF